jgi:anti-anti-sigma factor
MNISTSTADGVTVVVFEGSLDTNTAPDAQSRFEELVGEGATKLVVDFEALDYISSTGLRVLLATAKRLRSAGGSLRLCALNETVAEVFEISGFDTILSVFESRDAALAGF